MKKRRNGAGAPAIVTAWTMNRRHVQDTMLILMMLPEVIIN